MNERMSVKFAMVVGMGAATLMLMLIIAGALTNSDGTPIQPKDGVALWVGSIPLSYGLSLITDGKISNIVKGFIYIGIGLVATSFIVLYL